jgi:hypothetical protein
MRLKNLEMSLVFKMARNAFGEARRGNKNPRLKKWVAWGDNLHRKAALLRNYIRFLFVYTSLQSFSILVTWIL